MSLGEFEEIVQKQDRMSQIQRSRVVFIIPATLCKQISTAISGRLHGDPELSRVSMVWQKVMFKGRSYSNNDAFGSIIEIGKRADVNNLSFEM